MGTPVAPVIVDIFMAHMETTSMDRLIDVGLYEWHRYVDGTFVRIASTTNVSDVLHILNNLHSSNKFTDEVETDQSLPCLDDKLTRSFE
jgi:selenophosphate synthetase-related protein